MRSFLVTFMLAAVALAACGVAAWSFTQGNFNGLWGAPPIEPGQKLYSDFEPSEVAVIRVAQQGINAKFVKKDHSWQAVKPWQDRMDPRALQAIVQFTAGLRVEDVANWEEVDRDDAGLGKRGTNLVFESGDGEVLAEYVLGGQAPWLASVEGLEDPVATVFIRPKDRHRNRHIYICAGDINPLFKDGMKFLRDHHPFYFNPIYLKQLRLRTAEGELTLGREDPRGAWRILKPLELPTNPETMKRLLEGLYELQAVKLEDRAGVTLVPLGSQKNRQIALQAFGEEEATVLDIWPPASADARDVLATVSDRLGTVFHLPVQPETGLVSLADLPLSVAELRDPALTHLNIASLQGIAIKPSGSPEIQLDRRASGPWQVTIDGETQLANESQLYDLLKAITQGKALRFVSDAATDFTPWGLAEPTLTLQLIGKDHQFIELAFGKDQEGQVFVNRVGTPTVMQVDPSLLSSIAVRPYEWRHARPWAISRIDLTHIERKPSETVRELLLYDNLSEEWQAFRGTEDATADLIPARASFLLGALENLQVSRWLAVDDRSAIEALQNPSLRFRILEDEVDEFGDPSGKKIRHELVLAAAGDGERSFFYYGQIAGEPHYFWISRETWNKLTVELFER